MNTKKNLQKSNYDYIIGSDFNIDICTHICNSQIQRSIGITKPEKQVVLVRKNKFEIAHKTKIGWNINALSEKKYETLDKLLFSQESKRKRIYFCTVKDYLIETSYRGG